MIKLNVKPTKEGWDGEVEFSADSGNAAIDAECLRMMLRSINGDSLNEDDGEKELSNQEALKAEYFRGMADAKAGMVEATLLLDWQHETAARYVELMRYGDCLYVLFVDGKPLLCSHDEDDCRNAGQAHIDLINANSAANGLELVTGRLNWDDPVRTPSPRGLSDHQRAASPRHEPEMWAVRARATPLCCLWRPAQPLGRPLRQASQDGQPWRFAGLCGCGRDRSPGRIAKCLPGF